MSKALRPWETHYNGFSWRERCAVTPIQNAMFRSGELVRPTTCSICGFSDPARINGSGYIFAHLEDYEKPGELFPACKRCHAALHARFLDPQRWPRWLNSIEVISEWPTHLSLDPISQWRPFSDTYPSGLALPRSIRRAAQLEQHVLPF
jgi:hypothetical protein